MGTKITDGLNDRPRDATIGQTGEGLPDDSGRPVVVDENEVERVRRKLLGETGEAGPGGAAEAEAHPS